MLKAMIFLAILVLVEPMWASDLFVGTWELNIAKSEFPSTLLEALGIPGPKQETIVVRELSRDEIEVIVTGTNIDESPNSKKYTVPIQGGI